MRILLIDDHTLFRDGMALLLSRLGTDINVVEAGTCEQAFALIDRIGIVDLVLIDLNMPGMSGMDGLAILRERHPDLPVVVVSSDDDMATVLQTIDRGAMGFIPKSASSDVMIGALKLILAKGIYLPPSVFLVDRQAACAASAAVDNSSAQNLRERTESPAGLSQLGLTPRQIDVLYLILQGKSAKIICRELGLSISTVKTHTGAVLRALKVTTRTQAILAANKLGLVFDTATA